MGDIAHAAMEVNGRVRDAFRGSIPFHSGRTIVEKVGSAMPWRSFGEGTKSPRLVMNALDDKRSACSLGAIAIWTCFLCFWQKSVPQISKPRINHYVYEYLSTSRILGSVNLDNVNLIGESTFIVAKKLPTESRHQHSPGFKPTIYAYSCTSTHSVS